MVDVSRQELSLLSILFIFIFIGVPLWWKTTEVYRSTLPYAQISYLKTQKDVLVIPCSISVISLAENLDIELPSSINKTIQSSENMYLLHCTLKHVHVDSQAANDILLKLAADVNESPYDTFHSIGYYTVYIVPHGTIDQLLFVSDKRHAVVENDQEGLNDTLMTAINQLCGVERISYFLSSTNFNQKPDLKSLRRVKVAAGYDINIVLINSDPHSINAHWNIEEATDNILLPFLQNPSISKLANYTVSTQVFYYTDIKLSAHYSEEYKSYHASAAQLPTMVSNVEARLGSYVSQWPSLNFVVYIPKPSKCPLYIVQNSAHRGPGVDSFLVPQWGGVMFYNPLEILNNETNVFVRMETVMPTIIKQLKLLFGLQTEESLSCNLTSSDTYCLSSWDVDHLLIVQTVEKLTSAKASLVSLVELLDDVKNMVISDIIQQEVILSLDHINKCLDSISKMDWNAAHIAASLALHHAEVAFFDPSILALLYFPDDQKYAIYVPLFLPISLPIVTSVFKLIKSLKAKRKID